MSEADGRLRVDVSDLGPGETRALEAGDGGVLLCNVEGEIHAVRNRCTHAAVLLSEALLEDGVLTCPYHGARFEVATGDVRLSAVVVTVDERTGRSTQIKRIQVPLEPEARS